MTKLKPCPKCGYNDANVDSSRDMGISEVRCVDCGYTLQKPVPEERIQVLWNRLDRTRMPNVPAEEEDAGGPYPSLETHPFEYRLRYPVTSADIWGPCKSEAIERLLSDPHFQVRRRSHEFDMRDLAKRQAAEASRG